MTNKYLEKIAGLTKVAWDSDYTLGNYYGICANRSIGGNPKIGDEIIRASKDPVLKVYVEGEGEDGWEEHQDTAGISKHVNFIKSIVPTKTVAQHTKDYTMEWHRDHSWGISADTTHPEVLKNIGRYSSRYGMRIEDPKSAALHYIHSKYDI